jgi:chromosome segregation ATPase
MTPEGIITLLVALIGAISGSLAYIGQRRKVAAEATDIGVGSLQKVIKVLSEQIDSLKSEQTAVETALSKAKADLDAGHSMLRNAREQIALAEERMGYLARAAGHLVEGVDDLAKQLRENDITPAWKPDLAILKAAGLTVKA